MLSEPMTCRDTLSHLRLWLQEKLQNSVAYVPADDRSGHPRGWTAVQIADWEVRQKLDLMAAAIEEDAR